MFPADISQTSKADTVLPDPVGQWCGPGPIKSMADGPAKGLSPGPLGLNKTLHKSRRKQTKQGRLALCF